MLDTFSKKEDYHLLIDQETFGVLTQVRSIPILHALSLGIANSSAMNVFLPKVNVFQTLQSGNVILGRKSAQALIPSECNVAKSMTSTPDDLLFALVPFPNASADFIAKKQLASIRAVGLSILEQKIERYLTRAKTFTGDEILVPFLNEELKKDSSPAINEWARIQELSLTEAKADLEIKIKSAQLITLRLHAVWEKYVRKINSLYTLDDINKCVKYDLEIELRSGSQ